MLMKNYNLFLNRKAIHNLYLVNLVPVKLEASKGYGVIKNWLCQKGFVPFQFQEETWQHIIDNQSGLVNAPTGCGKTFSVFLGTIIQFINNHPEDYKTKNKNGLQLLWITPLRALAKDLGRAMEEVIFELGMNWKVGIRNGDTSISDRQKQKRQTPEVLLITPESLHLLLAQKNYPEFFATLKIIAVDEWHELLGSKRGVQVELALSRIIGQLKMENGKLKIENATSKSDESSKAIKKSKKKFVCASYNSMRSMSLLFSFNAHSYPISNIWSIFFILNKPKLSSLGSIKTAQKCILEYTVFAIER